jgi:hypothetical protein
MDFFPDHLALRFVQRPGVLARPRKLSRRLETSG